MKKVPTPIRIWPLKRAPKRYRQLLRNDEANGQIDRETRRQMAWVASRRGDVARKAFWGDFGKPAADGSLARATRAGVFFHRTDLGDEEVFFFTDNDEGAESST